MATIEFKVIDLVSAQIERVVKAKVGGYFVPAAWPTPFEALIDVSIRGGEVLVTPSARLDDLLQRIDTRAEQQASGT